jgi:hypothetical protein
VIGIKFGITNKFDVRIKQLRKGMKDGTLENICFFVGDGQDVFDTERKIKSVFETSFFSKETMKDGFTETVEFSIDNIEKLMKTCSLSLELVESEV